MFIEHILRAERLQARMHAVQLYNRRDISADRATSAYTVFVYGHIQGVGVTAYRIYYIVHVKLERWGQMLRIIGNSWKKQLK